MHEIIHIFQALQHWLAVQTGTYIPPGQYSDHYNFWSGSGSDVGEIVLVGSVLAVYKHHNCAVPRCPRIAHKKYEIEEIKEYTCKRHHTTYWEDLLIEQYKEDYPDQYAHIQSKQKNK